MPLKTAKYRFEVIFIINSDFRLYLDWQGDGTLVRTVNMKLQYKDYLWMFFTAGLTAIVFIPAVRGEFLYWDDYTLFVENPYFRGLSLTHWKWMCTTFLLGHWQPLSWLSYALDYKVWVLNPQGWHVTSLVLHTINAGLVYLLSLALFTDRARCYIAAGIAALFWSVHPLRVEAVVWLATRGYLLCTTFCLLAFLFYIRSVKQKCYPLAALLFFALATATKGIGMMIPMVLLLLDRTMLGRITSIRTAFYCTAEKIPFFIFSLVTGLVAFWSKRFHGGMASIEQYGLDERAGQAICGIWFYLLKTVEPVNLSPLYYKRPGQGSVIAALILTAGIAVFLFLFRRKLRPIILALSAFLLLIFPMIGLTQSGIQIFADRFTYLAAIPFSILLAHGLSRIQYLYRPVFAALSALLLIFSVQTFVWSGTWTESLLLWNQGVSVDRNNVTALNGLGLSLLYKNCFTNALELFDRAIEINPAYVVARHNRALTLAQLGRSQEAFTEWDTALALSGGREKDRAKILLMRGWVFEQGNDLPSAVSNYSAIINNLSAGREDILNALRLRADLYYRVGNLVSAEADYLQILDLPDPADFHHSKAREALAEIKKIPEE